RRSSDLAARVVTCVVGGGGISVEVPFREVAGDETAERMPAAQHLPLPQRRVGKFVTQQVVLVAQRLFETDMREPCDVGAARVAGESSPVHFGTVEVVVGRGVERTRPQCRPGTGVVLEAV